MAVCGINHVNIRSTDIAASAGFYSDVLGFTYRTHEVFGGFTSHWLHDEADQPIIHLRAMAPDAASTGPIDHVALNCRGKAGVIARLEARAIPFQVIENMGTSGVTLVLFNDPHGIALELNFAQE
ncbi:MAG: VOC family protein [Sphingomonadales bacterium]|nr:VOC family protein [Sphingomonadales bacterium]